jgi:cyclopropane-fatty-acyl-phospholipid synthase
MTMVAHAIRLAEATPLPDPAIAAGVSWLVARQARKLDASHPATETAFLADMARRPIAVSPEAANSQHYELPPELFVNMLGPRLKYSCCLFATPQTSLAEAEVAALAETVAHADLADGQDILEWGCGWGSLTLYMAERFPAARIVAVSNSAPQRAFILAHAAQRGLRNVEIVTADMNAYEPDQKFDRLVSVEMFEHMSNWRALLTRARTALKPEGRLFLHVFAHRSRSYRFDPADPADWIAQHFFTGGVMPAFDLPGRFPDLFALEQSWRWSGTHYERTAQGWLDNFDSRREEIDVVLSRTYGADALLWARRWRWFLLATRGLFGHAGGEVWGVGHYRLAPAK